MRVEERREEIGNRGRCRMREERGREKREDTEGYVGGGRRKCEIREEAMSAARRREETESCRRRDSERVTSTVSSRI